MSKNTPPSALTIRVERILDIHLGQQTAKARPKLVQDLTACIEEVSTDNSSDIPLAFNLIKRAIETDMDFAWSWHCNIAIASVDEGLSYEAANKAAARFMYNCFGVKTDESKQYKVIFSPKE